MQLNRRTVLLGIISSAMPFTGPLQAQRSASPWIEVVKVLGDVGESLATFAESVGKIASLVMDGNDRLKRRSVRAALVRTSGKLSAIISDQQRVQTSLDQYGDIWRRSHGSRRRPSPDDRRALARQWLESVSIIRSVVRNTTSVLEEIRTFDADIVLDDAYLALQEALTAKIGLLDSLSRMPAPNKPEELRRLVANEETFLHLRAEAKGALNSVNQAIKAIKT
jgi:hypothetical protein